MTMLSEQYTMSLALLMATTVHLGVGMYRYSCWAPRLRGEAQSATDRNARYFVLVSAVLATIGFAAMMQAVVRVLEMPSEMVPRHRETSANEYVHICHAGPDSDAGGALELAARGRIVHGAAVECHGRAAGEAEAHSQAGEDSFSPPASHVLLC